MLGGGAGKNIWHVHNNFFKQFSMFLFIYANILQWIFWAVSTKF